MKNSQGRVMEKKTTTPSQLNCHKMIDSPGISSGKMSELKLENQIIQLHESGMESPNPQHESEDYSNARKRHITLLMSTQTSMSTTRLKGVQSLLFPLLLFLLLLNLLTPHLIVIESEALINVTLFQVPPLARVGQTRRLRCAYKLDGGETLHAMKLFKDDKEFYRYSPGARELADRKLVFPVVGVQVDMKRSDEKDVVLVGLTRQSAGLYKCLVSVEDTFKSVSQEKRMEIGDTSGASSAWNQMASGDNRLQAGNAMRQQQQHKILSAPNSIHNNNNNNNNAGQSHHQLPVNSMRGQNQQLGFLSPSSGSSRGGSLNWPFAGPFISLLTSSISMALMLS